MHTLQMRCLGNLGIFETSTSHFPIQLDSISHKAPKYRISNTSTRPNLHGLYAWMHMLLYAWRLKGNRPWKKGRKKILHSYFTSFVKKYTIYRLLFLHTFVAGDECTTWANVSAFYLIHRTAIELVIEEVMPKKIKLQHSKHLRLLPCLCQGWRPEAR